MPVALPQFRIEEFRNGNITRFYPQTLEKFIKDKSYQYFRNDRMCSLWRHDAVSFDTKQEAENHIQLYKIFLQSISVKQIIYHAVD